MNVNWFGGVPPRRSAQDGASGEESTLTNAGHSRSSTSSARGDSWRLPATAFRVLAEAKPRDATLTSSVRMRIVALSDQHGFLSDIPPCDLLIVAGDVCPDRFGPFMAVHDPYQQQAWFDRKVRPWLADAPATHKLLTWGNHDWCGQACSFRSDSPARARSMDLQILVDEGTTTVPCFGGAGGHVSVWATPWSNRMSVPSGIAA